MTILEISDKIPHPSVSGCWIAGVLVCAISGWVAYSSGRRPPGLLICAVWASGAVLWTLTLFIDDGTGLSQGLMAELGVGYFTHLLLAPLVPIPVVLLSARAAQTRSARPPVRSDGCSGSS